MTSIRLRTIPRLFLSLFLTFTAVGASVAQTVGSAPAVSKEGVAPAQTAGADGATAAAAATTDGSVAGGGDQAAINAGDALFKGNCSQCHAVNEQVVGPALKGIAQRRTMAWLIPWIKNSSKVVASGDAYAVALYNKYGKQQMPSFQLSDNEIKSIIAYVTSQEGGATAVVGGVTAGNQAVADGQTADTDAAGGGQYVDMLLIVLVVVLIVLVVTLVIIANIMKDVLRGRKDLDGRDVEVLEQRFDFSKIYKSSAVRGITVTVFILVVLYESVQAAMGIGLTQGLPANPAHCLLAQAARGREPDQLRLLPHVGLQGQIGQHSFGQHLHELPLAD